MHLINLYGFCGVIINFFEHRNYVPMAFYLIAFVRVNEKARFEMLIRIFGRVDKIGKFVVFPSLAAGLAWGVSKLLRRVM